MNAHPILPSGYGDWLKSLKSRIASARQRAALAVNQELVTLYHSIGKDIVQRQASEGWGAKVIQRLSTDLGEAFPDPAAREWYAIRAVNEGWSRPTLNSHIKS